MKSLKELNKGDSLDFFDCYKTWYSLGENVIEEKNNIAYKEFSQELTYWIKCLPE